MKSPSDVSLVSAWFGVARPRDTFRRAAQMLLAGAGFGLLVWMVAEVGVETLRATLQPVGIAGLASIGLVFTFSQLPSCLAWRGLMPRTVPLGVLVRAYIVGDAFNLTVPSGDTAGELAKIVLLRRRLPWEGVAASLTLHRMLDLIGLCVLMVGGLVVAWVRFALPLWWYVTGAIMLVGTVSLIAGFFVAQRRSGFYAPLLRGLVRRFGVAPDIGAAIDRELRNGVSRRPALAWSAVLVVGSWVGGVGEVYLCLRLLGLPARWDVALVADAFGVIAGNLAFFVPGRLGMSDGGRVLVLSALGVNWPGAVAFVVLRRIREVAWAALGFALLLSHREVGPTMRIPAELPVGDSTEASR